MGGEKGQGGMLNEGEGGRLCGEGRIRKVVASTWKRIRSYLVYYEVKQGICWKGREKVRGRTNGSGKKNETEERNGEKRE